MATWRNEPRTAKCMGGLKRQIYQRDSPCQLGYQERNKVSHGTTPPRTQDNNPYLKTEQDSKKPQWHVSAQDNHSRRRSNGLGRIQTTTKIAHLARRISKTHARKAMAKMRTARTPSRYLHKTRSTKAIQPKNKQLATSKTKRPMATTTKDPRNGSQEVIPNSQSAYQRIR